MNTNLSRCLDLIHNTEIQGEEHRTQSTKSDSGKLYRRNYQFLCQIKPEGPKTRVGNGESYIRISWKIRTYLDKLKKVLNDCGHLNPSSADILYSSSY